MTSRPTADSRRMCILRRISCILTSAFAIYNAHCKLIRDKYRITAYEASSKKFQGHFSTWLVTTRDARQLSEFASRTNGYRYSLLSPHLICASIHISAQTINEFSGRPLRFIGICRVCLLKPVTSTNNKQWTLYTRDPKVNRRGPERCP